MTSPAGDVQLLQAVVEGEHAAVYGYGLLGARLDEAARELARTAFDSHRSRRDDAVAVLLERREPVPAAAPAYDATATTAAEALALAVRVEEGVAVRWRDLVGGTDDAALRRLAVAGLTECAVRAAQWRRRARTTPVTVALPGTPPPS